MTAAAPARGSRDRLGGARSRGGLRPGRLVARRQADAARQAVRPAVPRPLHRRGARGRADAAEHLRRRRHQALHRRGRRLRRRLPRLRQRRLARRAGPRAARGSRTRRPSATNRLYRNNRDGTFTDVTAKAGLTRTGWASSVTVGDFDNDGFDDLFITGYGYDALYRNNGDGTFTDVTAKAGLVPTATRYGAGCTWIDYDRDGRLDLLVAALPRHDAGEAAQAGRELRLPLEGRAGQLRPARPADRLRPAVPQQRRRHVHRREQGVGRRGRRRSRTR